MTASRVLPSSFRSDWLDETDSVLVCLMTTTRRAAPVHRLEMPAGASSGLRHASQIMVEKIMAVRRDTCGAVTGRLDAAELVSLGRLLALMIGVAD